MPKAAVGLCRYFERHIQNTYLVCIMNVGILNVATLILTHFDRALFIVIFFGILNAPFWYFELVFCYFEPPIYFGILKFCILKPTQKNYIDVS